MPRWPPCSKSFHRASSGPLAERVNTQGHAMSEHNERWALNRLIDTCRDGERGFRYAANHVGNPTVKTLFLNIASQREQFAAELLPHAQRLGGASESDGSFAGG